MDMKKLAAEYSFTKAIKYIKELVNQAIQDGYENEQFFINFLDELNEISVIK